MHHIHRTPHTTHHTPHTTHHTPHTTHHTPHTAPHTPHPTPQSPDPKPLTPNPEPQAPNHGHPTLNAEPEPQTPDPGPRTQKQAPHLVSSTFTRNQPVVSGEGCNPCTLFVAVSVNHRALCVWCWAVMHGYLNIRSSPPSWGHHRALRIVLL